SPRSIDWRAAIVVLRRGVAAERVLKRQPIAALQSIERGEWIGGGRDVRAIDVAACFHAPADHHAEHEHQTHDHGSAEEQIEDLSSVEADFDLVLVEVDFARHAHSVGNYAPRGKKSPDT